MLGYGPQAIDWITKASKLCGKDAVMDSNVARMAGATMAAGSPQALAALRKQLEAGALEAAKEASPSLSEAATKWLASGERGVSSDTLFTHLTGIDALRGWRKDHPYDPADLRRCRLLLEQVPELVSEFPRMAKVSKAWAALVREWDTICATMDEEAPNWRTKGERAAKTYELIKQAIGR